MLIRAWGPKRGCGIFRLWQELCALKTLKKIMGILGYLGKPRSGRRRRQILQQAELYSHSPQNAELRTKHPDVSQKNLQRSEEPPSCSSECLSPPDTLHSCPCLPLMLWAPPGVGWLCQFLVGEWKVQQMLRWREVKDAPEPESCNLPGQCYVLKRAAAAAAALQRFASLQVIGTGNLLWSQALTRTHTPQRHGPELGE